MASEFVQAVTSLTAGVSDHEVAATLLSSAQEATGAQQAAVRVDRGGAPLWVTADVDVDKVDRLSRHLDFHCGYGRPVRCLQSDAVVRGLGRRDIPASVLRESGTADNGLHLEVLLLNSCRVDGFSIDDQNSLGALVAVAALAISNRAQSVSRRRFEEWMTVIEDTSTLLLRGVAPRAVLDSVLDSIAREALRTTGSEMAGVATPDASGTSMMFRVAVGNEREYLARQPFPEEHSLSGQVKRTGEPLLVADAVLDPRAYGPIVERIGLGPTAVGPLWLNGRAIGVVFVGNHRHGRELDRDLALRAVTGADLGHHLQVSGPQAAPSGEPANVEQLVTSASARLSALDKDLDGWSRLLALDDREIDLLMMVAEGLTNREIADQLGLAEKTIRNTMTMLWSRLGVRNRVQAAVLVARHVERLGRLGALTSGDHNDLG